MARLLLILMFIAQVACASITGSATDRLRVVSSPANATVSVNGEHKGSAPMSVALAKREHNVLEVSAPGYQTATCDTHMSPAGGYIAADIALCVFLFPIGCISFIDAGGAWNELDSPHCNVSLSAASKP